MRLATRSFLSLIAVTALSTLPAGCSDRPQIWSQPLEIQGPHRVDGAGRADKEQPFAGRAMWVDSARGLVLSLDPKTSTIRSVAIGRNATYSSPSPTREVLLVLTAGKEALRVDQTEESPALTVIEPSEAGPRVLRRYPLESAFDRLAVSDDGRFAVAHFSEQRDGTDDDPALFRNPNEVAMIDLSAEPGDDNPAPRTLRSFGASPRGVVFSPELAIPKGGDKRTLALVLSRNYVTFLDMHNRKRREITVRLNAADASGEIVPEQALFTDDPPTVYLRAQGTADLFALALEPKKATAETENDFLPQVNQPTAGRNVLDMIVFDAENEEGETRRLILAANATQDLALIDAASSEFSIIKVGEPIDTIVPVPREAPTLALLYSASSPRNRIHYVELERLTIGLERNVSHRTLSKPIRQLVTIPGDVQALAVHDDARSVVSVLELTSEHRTDTPIQGRVPLGSFDFTADGFLVGVAPGLKRLGILDLAQLHPIDLRLDYDPLKVVAVGNHIVVDHGTPGGLITVVPKAGAAREDTRVIWGFFLDGLMDRELTD